MDPILQNQQTEVAFVAGVCRGGRVAADLVQRVPPDVFTRPDLRTLWATTLPTLVGQDALSLAGVTVALAASGDMELPEELAVRDALSDTMLEASAKDLLRLAHARALRGSALVAGDTVARGEDPGLVSYELTQALDEAAARFAPQIDPTMADAAYLFDRWRDQLRARREAGGSGVGWGIPEIDRHGELWPSYGLLLGRTSHGKTAVACQSALGKAWQGTPAVIASLEQPRPQVVARLLCLLTGLPWRVVLGKDGTPEALAIVDRALTWLRTTPNLTVIDGRRTVDQIIGCARRLRDQGKCDILYIDQMSRIDHQQHPREHMEQAWTRTSNRIARAWQELQIPIVLLAQLNIKSADEHAEPALSQVKNCGTMGEDCCWCLLIDRPEAEPARFAKLEAERGRLISKGKYQEATDVDYRGKVKLHCVKDRASNLGGEWTEVLPFDRTCGRIGGPIQAVAAAAAEQEA